MPTPEQKQYKNSIGICECCGHMDGTYNSKVCDGYVLSPGSWKCRRCLDKNTKPKNYGMASQNHLKKIEEFDKLLTGKKAVVVVNPAGRPLVKHWTNNTPPEKRVIPVPTEVDSVLASGADEIFFILKEKSEADWLKSRCKESKKVTHIIVGTIESTSDILRRISRALSALRVPSMIHFNTSGSMVRNCLNIEMSLSPMLKTPYVEVYGIVSQETVKNLGYSMFGLPFGETVATFGKLPKHDAIALVHFS